MIKLNKHDYVVFDCDGVILDSNEIKTNAFRHALDGYPASDIEQLVKYHKNHGGISRYEKFRHFFEHISGSFDQKKYELALENFQVYCRENVVSADLIPGVLDYFRALKQIMVPMFVVSGADQDELRSIFRQKQISHYFSGVLGSPTSKRANLTRLFDKGLLRGRGVFFGDARLDYDIAVEKNIDFVFVYEFSEWSDGQEFCRARNIPCISNFSEIAIDSR